MLVGVVSDTHGNQEGMHRLAELLRAAGVSTLLHVGDDYRDLAFLAREGLTVLGVPGVYCPEYSDPQIPNRQVVEVNGVKVLLTHTETRHRLDAPQDPDPQAPARGVKVVIYGHSHLPALQERAGVLWLNPGHLKDRTDKGHPPTFALLRLTPERAEVEIRRLEDNAVVLREAHQLPI